MGLKHGDEIMGKKGRKPLSEGKFIRVDDHFGVMTDPYNVILYEIHTDESGKLIHSGRCFVGTFSYMAEIMSKYGVSPEDAEKFGQRTQDVKTHWDKGRLVIEYPEGFTFDENPFPKEDSAVDE
jgi:hypothetical protein